MRIHKSISKLPTTLFTFSPYKLKIEYRNVVHCFFEYLKCLYLFLRNIDSLRKKYMATEITHQNNKILIDLTKSVNIILVLLH